MARRNEWGRVAEQLAADYLVCHGYTLRERNWRPRGSRLELDIIAERGMTMVFVEVKARSGQWDCADEAVDDRKIRRICRAADVYLASAGGHWDYRFDIITLTGDESCHELEHIEDAFMPPLDAL